MLKGLVVGELDKNLGELSAVCPVLYLSALEKMYSAGAGYEVVEPKKCTQQMKTRFGADVSKYVITPDVPPARSKRG